MLRDWRWWLAFLAFAAVLGWLVSVQAVATTVILISVGALIIGLVLVRASGRKVDLFEPIWMFTAFYMFSFGLKPLLLILNPQNFAAYPQYLRSSAHFPLAFALGIAGLGAFFAGYLSPLSKPLVRVMPNLGESRIQRWRLVVASLVGFAGGILLLAQFIQDVTPNRTEFIPFFDRGVRSAVLTSVSGKGHQFFLVLVIPLFALTYVYFAADKRSLLAGKVIPAIFTIGALVAMGTIGSRTQILGLLVGAVVVFHFSVRRFRLGLQTSMLILAATFGGLLGNFLDAGQGRTYTPFNLLTRLAATFDGFEGLTMAIDRGPNYFWGLTVAEDIALTFLPRAVVPSKPQIYGITRVQQHVFSSTASPTVATFPPGILAEGYANFGTLGALLIPLLLGATLRAIYEKARSHGGVNLVLLAAVEGQMIGALRGFGSFVAGFIALMVVCWFFYRFRSPLWGLDRSLSRSALGTGQIPQPQR